MVGKATISVLILALLLLTTSIFIATVDLRSYLYPILLPRPGGRFPCSTGGGPLMVYMYDLPRRFHVGMLRRRSPADESPVTAENLPPWPSNSGLKKQHSVEYWMMASLLYDGGGGNETREAVRVWDPEMADAFFVPFFSSLSFNTHGHNMTDPDTEFDRQLQIDILKILRESKYWQRSGDFGRYPKEISNLRKDVVAPYVHVVDSFTDDNSPDPYESRTTLLFFRGRTIRKDEGIVRAKLAKLLAGYDDVIYEQSFASGANIKVSTQGMRSSKFCLHPAGDTPSSCRLFDAIVSHCVPVIVSDQIELPYEDEIDYTQFSIFFSDKEALEPGYMIEQLRQIPKERWVEMWRHLKYISHHYEFQYPPKKGDAIDMLWRQVKHKLPRANLDVHRSRRLKVPDWWDHRR
ncbi:probable arabinosyltransferase ARAD1 isoform X4 [Vitis vinifera]|uniref:probable arabinosyltransferase ARAD1 isoform X4 n=1 Tax=Vitis vinifera TaxID=29760 RepID=UPI0028830612|nr:probable arabinosyltransferase ARAD1 isoform X4 [Vitis vinifera]